VSATPPAAPVEPVASAGPVRPSQPAAADSRADVPSRPAGFVAARDWRRAGARLTTQGPDEALYDQGLQQEQAGDARGARRTYYELIQKHPASPLIPYAYFAFGEMFLEESKGDPSKLDLCEQAFKEVVKYAQSPIVPEAYARLGEVYTTKGDAARATAMLRKLHRDFPASDAAARSPKP
jgi:TolA-binding protein